MLFNSYIFWVFLATVLVLYYLLPHRAQNVMLLIASYIFYGAWNWHYLWLIAFCSLLNYYAGLLISTSSSPRVRRATLITASAISLGLLGVFKYANFFIEQVNASLHWWGMNAALAPLGDILPVGISFFTFQAMSYTIDVYRGHVTTARKLSDFLLYVALFPQLVAGPIERSSHLLPQVLEPRPRIQSQFREGLYHVMLGLFKKVVIADNLAPIVNAVFNAPDGTTTGFDGLLAVYAFAFQIYGDFSGYSSIAQGVAKWMGFDLMDNFRMPYFAQTPSDFWQRWHISLSSWLRDYLYIGLGGNRRGIARTYRNLMLTMVLGGLWHGAAWTFVAWGLFHGLLLCVYRPFEARTPSPKPIVRLLKTFFMFHLICISWLLFRADSIRQAGQMLISIFTNPSTSAFSASYAAMIVFFAGPFMLYEYWVYRQNDLLALTRKRAWLRALIYLYCLIMMIFFPPPVANEFIYFRF